ncbi:hypothetical protein KKJ22_20420, partial [Xenorhabdus bovienii]|nr:hypothetical protein [Xenorhabdus bovienii]
MKKNTLQKTLIAVFISLSLLGNTSVFSAPTEDSLPDIGTTAGAILSINQEMVMGDLYIRSIRAQAPLIYDPLLT